MTVARLSFWTPPEHRDEFEAAYRKKLVPILKKYELAESSEQGRPPVEGIFSKLFEVETPAAIAAKEQALQNDPAWQEALHWVRKAWETTDAEESLLCWHLWLYTAPAGAGKVVEAGPGKTVKAGGGLHQGPWHTLDVVDGLPSSIIYAILQDRRGYLWFGTKNGVSRYDGQTFHTFSTQDGLTGDGVGFMLEDRQGHLWFGTENGVSRYDGQTFHTFSTQDGLTGQDGLTRGGIGSMLEDRQGHLWFGTVSGEVSRYDGQVFHTFTTQDGLVGSGIMSILEDRQGYLWFSTVSGGVSRYDGQVFRTFTTQDGLADNGVWSMLEDRQGHLWFGTNGDGVSRYDGQMFHTFTTQDGLAGSRVISVLEDRQGHLWFGTFGDGVSRYDGQVFRTFTTQDGLMGNTVGAMLEDREGNLWFGPKMALGDGVGRFDGTQIEIFTTAEGLVNNNVCSMLEDREGHLWFGAWKGVSRYDGQVFTTLDGLEADVRSIAQDRKGHLWFGTMVGGVYRYDGKQVVNFTLKVGLANLRVEAVLVDREGYLWFGTLGGVSRYDGQTFKTFTTQDGLAGNSVWSMLEDGQGHLWFGTLGGVSRYDGQTFKTFTTQDGLAAGTVRTIFEDSRGDLWFGTNGGGVSCYDGQTFETFTTQNGLSYDTVHSIMEDRHGHLWFGTYGGGVSRYDGRVFQHLNKRNGLPGTAIQHLLEDRHGDIWIAVDGVGVVRYRSRQTAPPIQLTDVIADRHYGPVSSLRLPSSQSLFAFEFHGLSFKTGPGQMLYLYRLQGYEENWRPTRENRVEYTDLPVGNYTFQVQAVDRDLTYSEEPATVEVDVVPDPLIEGLTEALSHGDSTDEFVGTSEALRQVQAQLKQVASTDLAVMILGETGTGKGLAARTLHRLSERSSGALIQVNCGALPKELVESELFGHEKGAFTGATSRKLGKVELAKAGTLFLDEIGDMPLEAQVKLLRLLEEQTFERVGGTDTLKAEARVIAATNRDLGQMVEDGQFREDLYFRLQVFPIQLPPLRQRQEDIPLLVHYAVERFAHHLNRAIPTITPAAMVQLQSFPWPGNVRELEHLMQRAVLLCQKNSIDVADVTTGLNPSPEVPEESAFLSLAEQEKRHIEHALEATDWVIFGKRGAAQLLGINPHTLRSRIKKYGLHRSD